MAKRSDDESIGSPGEIPGPAPKDLYPTSDIRFVMRDLGGLDAKVTRLIDDVKGQTSKLETERDKLSSRLDKIEHGLSFMKGAFWVAGALMTFIMALLSWYFSGKMDRILEQLAKH